MTDHEDPYLKERLDEWAATSTRCPSFSGGSKELPEWFQTIEFACEENDVDLRNWAEAAIMFISGDLKPVMDERRMKFLEQSPDTSFWAWDDFKDDIVRVVAEGERIQAEAEKSPLGAAKDTMDQLRREHPYVAASAGVGLAVGGSIVIIPALGILAVKAIGFTLGALTFRTVGTVARAVAISGVSRGAFSLLKSAWSGQAAETTPEAQGNQEEMIETQSRPPPSDASKEASPPVPGPRRMTLNERLASASKAQNKNPFV